RASSGSAVGGSSPAADCGAASATLGPSSASRPRPRPLGFLLAITRPSLHALHALHHLLREGQEGLAAPRTRIEHHARQTIARCLGQTDVARYHGVEHLVAKMALELLTDLLL